MKTSKEGPVAIEAKERKWLHEMRGQWVAFHRSEGVCGARSRKLLELRIRGERVDRIAKLDRNGRAEYSEPWPVPRSES